MSLAEFEPKSVWLKCFEVNNKDHLTTDPPIIYLKKIWYVSLHKFKVSATSISKSLWLLNYIWLTSISKSFCDYELHTVNKNLPFSWGSCISCLILSWGCVGVVASLERAVSVDDWLSLKHIRHTPLNSNVT
jgi:hypothetical protein